MMFEILFKIASALCEMLQNEVLYLKIRQLRHSWPHVISGGFQYSENAEKLVDFRITLKERPLVGHFGKNATYRRKK